MQKKTIIHTTKSPAALGPYTQAVAYNGVLYISGQVAIDPETSMLISGGIEDQTRRIMQNIQGVLNAGGLDFSHVLSTTIYLKNMSDYHIVNEIYGEYFDIHPPARTTVEVSRLTMDAIIEISAMAAAPSATHQTTSPEESSDSSEDTSDDAPKDPPEDPPSYGSAF